MCDEFNSSGGGVVAKMGQFVNFANFAELSHRKQWCPYGKLMVDSLPFLRIHMEHYRHSSRNLCWKNFSLVHPDIDN